MVPLVLWASRGVFHFSAWRHEQAHRSSKGSTAPVAPPSCKVAAWTSSLRNPLSSTLPGQLVPLGGGEPMYSFSVSEPFREVPGSSAYLDAYMRDIARPVVLPALATSPRKKVSLSSMPMSARRAFPELVKGRKVFFSPVGRKKYG
ncbi:unnamed protein product [Prorocentrum cordatum]|uniref:Uncharacterized protein n=1 Tax=Prorocentrum cordatum TaxID=2364126 RepID=A0ABN9RXX6_9DINO|nr:unnamed protein product [Polarella glacialis]